MECDLVRGRPAVGSCRKYCITKLNTMSSLLFSVFQTKLETITFPQASMSKGLTLACQVVFTLAHFQNHP